MWWEQSLGVPTVLPKVQDLCFSCYSRKGEKKWKGKGALVKRWVKAKAISLSPLQNRAWLPQSHGGRLASSEQTTLAPLGPLPGACVDNIITPLPSMQVILERLHFNDYY